MTHRKNATSQPHMLVGQAQDACTHGRPVCEDVFVCVVSFVFGTCLLELTDRGLANDEIFDHDRRVGSAHLPTNRVCPLTPVQRPSNAMGSCLSCQKRHSVVDAHATAVVNIFTLEVAVEDISTEGEAKGLKTAHETLLDKGGWTRPHCWRRRAEREVPTRIWFPERPSRGIQGSHRTRPRRPTDCIRDTRGHSLRRIRSLREVHEGEGKQGEGSDS